MKKILLSGVTSFIGHSLAKHLSAEYEVIGILSRKPTDYQDIQKIRLQELGETTQFISCDITSQHDLKKVIQDIGPNIFLHHAGYTKNYNSSQYDFAESLKINLHPLETIYAEMQKVKGDGIIITGTVMEYSDGQNPHQESEYCVPSTPYGLSKLFETLRAGQLSFQHHLPTRVIRVFNPYGAHDYSQKLLPFVINKLKNKEPVELTSCEQVRSFTHLTTLNEIYSYFIEDLKNGGSQIYNGISMEGISLKDFLMKVANTLQLDTQLLQFGKRAMNPHETLIQKGSIHKLSKTGILLPTSVDDELRNIITDFT